MTVIDLLAEAAYAYPTPSRSSDRHSEPVSPNLVTYVECLRTDSERRAANRFHSSSDIFSSLSRRCGSPWLSDSNRFVSSTRQVSQCSMWRRTNNNSSLSQSGSLCNSMANAPFRYGLRPVEFCCSKCTFVSLGPKTAIPETRCITQSPASRSFVGLETLPSTGHLLAHIRLDH
jgi:hypothetical protein